MYILPIYTTTGSDLPNTIAGYWVFTDDQNFNTGYPKAALVSVNIDDFHYGKNGVKSIAPTLTGKWAPFWHSQDRGEIRVWSLCFIVKT